VKSVEWLSHRRGFGRSRKFLVFISYKLYLLLAVLLDVRTESSCITALGCRNVCGIYFGFSFTTAWKVSVANISFIGSLGGMQLS